MWNQYDLYLFKIWHSYILTWQLSFGKWPIEKMQYKNVTISDILKTKKIPAKKKHVVTLKYFTSTFVCVFFLCSHKYSSNCSKYLMATLTAAVLQFPYIYTFWIHKIASVTMAQFSCFSFKAAHLQYCVLYLHVCEILIPNVAFLLPFSIVFHWREYQGYSSERRII